MSVSSVRGENKMERKIISVSSKRQVTIPQKYFDKLGFDNEAECILQNNAIIIRPIRTGDNGAFSEEILADLISQGFSGQELLAKFKEKSMQVSPAVKQLIHKADRVAQNGGGAEMADIFGEDD